MDAALQTRRSKRRPMQLSFASTLLFLAGALWIASFALPVFITSAESIPGYWVFIIGWMGFAFFQFAWYANLFMLLSIALMYRSPLKASVIAGIGMLLATQAFWFESVPSSGADAFVMEYGSGFWLWYLSIIMLGIAVFFGNDYIAPDEHDRLEKSLESMGFTPTNSANSAAPVPSSAAVVSATIEASKAKVTNAVLLAQQFEAKSAEEETLFATEASIDKQAVQADKSDTTEQLNPNQ